MLPFALGKTIKIYSFDFENDPKNYIKIQMLILMIKKVQMLIQFVYFL